MCLPLFMVLPFDIFGYPILLQDSLQYLLSAVTASRM